MARLRRYARRMHRSPWLPLALVAASIGCGGSDPGAPATAGDAAPTLPPGWAARLDEPDAALPLRARAVDGGLDVHQGPNATLWRAGDRADGSYRLTLPVTHLDSGAHPHGAGMVFGASDLAGDDQTYGYFLVRGDRHFLIKTRRGPDTHVVVPWTQSEAAAPEDEHGVTRNVLTVEVGADALRFLINDTEVHRTVPGRMPTEGAYGVRLMHDLHVRFGPFRLERSGGG